MGKHKKERQRSKSRDRQRERRRSSSLEKRRERSRERPSRSRSYERKKQKRRDRDHDRDSYRDRSGSDSRSRYRHKKSKKKSSRRYSSSESGGGTDTDSISSNDSAVLIAKLELKKMEEKKRLKNEKERRKAYETPEEKRARRMYKKQLKDYKRKEDLGWTNDIIHYDNDENPFGDSSLTKTFRWDKKLEKEGMGNINEEELDRLAKTRIVEQKAELEKVKASRLQRERERQERLEMDELEQRSKESDKFAKWKADEDQFHLKQALLRSTIRIQDGRAKPIDLLAKYISGDSEVDAVEMHEPYTYLNGLTTDDLEDLLEDIKVYQRLEKGTNAEFWEDITVIVEDELIKLRKQDSKLGSIYEAAMERREGINKAVARDVQSVFSGKTVEELEKLQKSIEKKLKDRTEGVDIGYWESLLSQLKAHSARGRLKDKHKENLKNKLAQLKAEQFEKQAEIEGIEGIEGLEGVQSSEPGPTEAGGWRSGSGSRPDSRAGSEASGEEQEESQQWEVDLNHSLSEFRAGGYSPAYIRLEDLPPGTVTFLEEEDHVRRNFDQQKALQGSKVENVLTGEEKALEKEAKKGMGEDEAVFSVESVLEQSYEWSDKYRPRKPRYFNRVHTGFEWNKYNQTHYDFDNPPPKIVQGYKFNIFYPDLIDKGATPQFKLMPVENGEYCILRVTAGPPYEDIAFKIVNREWEYGYKRGFRCQFHNNIFQLWFHFKRYRYRR